MDASRNAIFRLMSGGNSILFGFVTAAGAASPVLTQRPALQGRVGAIAGMIATSPVWLIGLPVGIRVPLATGLIQ